MQRLNEKDLKLKTRNCERTARCEMEIKELQEKFKDPVFRNKNHEFLFDKLFDQLNGITEVDEGNQAKLLHMFRILRNCCIQCCKNQTALLRTGIPTCVVRILLDNRWCFEDSTKLQTAGLQFIANFVAGNVEAQDHAWKICFPNLFVHHLSKEFVLENQFSISCMMLYNCLNDDRVEHILTNSHVVCIVVNICEALGKASETDWVILSINDHFLKNSKFLPLAFSKCSISAQCHVLEMFCDLMCDENNHGNLNDLNFTTIYLVEQFLQRYESFSGDFSDDTLKVFTKLLKALCWATAIPGSWTGEIGMPDLLNLVMKLLRDLSSVNKNILGVCADNDKVLAVHLASSFGKRDLVRLVGNLCFDNQPVQNEIHSLGGISLVLDACNIDDGNPFMQQWAIFAIRNLCQNNLPNQAEIAKLEKLGVGNSPILKSMGLTAIQNENGEMKVVPLE